MLELNTRTLPDQGVRVFGDRVVVRPDDPEAFTRAGPDLYASESGLLVPEGHFRENRPATTGVVVGLGDQYERAGMLFPFAGVLELGDRIIHSKYGMTELEVAGEKLIAMRFADVLGALPREA